MGYRVIAIDVGDSKRDYCLSLGAEAYLDAKTHNIEEAVASLTTPASGGGAAAVLVMANSGRAYEAALELVAPYGTLVCVGIPPPDQQVRFHPHLGIGKNVRIVGSAVGTRKDIWDAVEFVKRGVVTPVVEMAKLDDLSDIARNFGKVSEDWL
jgi:propanol-preferring alcohol dehydrogenase